MGWIVAPQRYTCPEPQDVILFGRRLLADVIKVRYPGDTIWIRVGPKSNDKCPSKRQSAHLNMEDWTWTEELMVITSGLGCPLHVGLRDLLRSSFTVRASDFSPQSLEHETLLTYDSIPLSEFFHLWNESFELPGTTKVFLFQEV